jgi:hypothetical protein
MPKKKAQVEDYVKHICETCEFNFGEICAAHDSLYGYGGKIEDFNATCKYWGISLEAFTKERNRYYGK